MKKIFILFLLIFMLSSCDLFSKGDDVKYEIEVDSLKYNGPYTKNAMPSTGDVRVLVVPINFSSDNKSAKNREMIDKAFNAKKGDINYHSVKSYYEESSYHKLHLSFDVANWYLPENGGTYYETYGDDSMDGLNILIEELLTDLDFLYNFSDYDSDSDGYIDAIWLVYNRPSDHSSDFWWAYTSMANSSLKWDDKKVKYFSFAPMDSMNDTVDATTFIHETGHLFGLDDYYSYSEHQQGGVYGMDMMDKNKGDHSSISKMLLGWIKPRIVNQSGEFEISSLATSEDVLLISNHTISTIYDEYFLIDYFTPEGANEGQVLFQSNSQPIKGIRVYHVNAKIAFDEKGNVTLGQSDCYNTGFMYNNSNEKNKFVSLLKANSESESDIFNNSMTGYYLYTPSSRQFGTDVYQNHTYFDGSNINFSFKVVELGEKAKINLEVK